MTKDKQQKKQDILVNAIIKSIQEKKGEQIVAINFANIKNSVCDYFIICQANSKIQVQAISESVIEKVKEITGIKPLNTEGFQNAEWILLDYFDVVVHVFQKDIRKFYKLENLWADALIKKIE
jgi:ribosome-associated protein